MARSRTDQSDALLDGLVQTSFAVMGVLTRVAAAHDLSLTQLRVLAILRDRRPRMTELATYLGLEKSTMSGLVARAEERGLVVRRPNADDARASDVLMTDAGRELAARVHAEIRRETAPVTAGLEPADRDALTAILARITA